MLKTVLAVAGLAAGGYVLRNQMRHKSNGSMSSRMSTTTESIEVEVPISTAYNQWTQFEDFPEFMAGVMEVRQLDDTHLHWHAKIAGKHEEWDSEITEQTPDRVIAWRSTSGVHNAGKVSFQKLSENRTCVELRIDYEPRGLTEKIGDAMGAVSMRAHGNLKRFKAFIEGRGKETGAWRGSVGGGQERSGSGSSSGIGGGAGRGIGSSGGAGTGGMGSGGGMGTGSRIGSSAGVGST
jgi:uncharacterized membrane protein